MDTLSHFYPKQVMAALKLAIEAADRMHHEMYYAMKESQNAPEEYQSLLTNITTTLDCVSERMRQSRQNLDSLLAARSTMLCNYIRTGGNSTSTTNNMQREYIPHLPEPEKLNTWVP